MIFIQKCFFTPRDHCGQTTLITTAMTSIPAPPPPRELIIPELVEQGGAHSGVAVAYRALLTESWDLSGGHGNWA